MKASFASHRLLVSRERWDRLRHLPAIPIFERAAKWLDELTDRWTRDFETPLDETVHNWHLIRARQAQTRVVSLLVQYGRTGDRRFREAAMEHLRRMAGWEYWSWITWRENEPDPNAIFDLSYGENSATLALAYDWLADELSPDERAWLLDTARTRALLPYLARNGVAGQQMWYYRKPDCNWNTVCNGGAGLLALALGDACPESGRVLELVEEGIRHYFEFMQEDGAWPEGIGYWNYGHRYGYYYLLSHERATGRPHPLLERPGSRNTLRFPLLFSPNQVSASFGDAGGFSPLPFHHAAAGRYGLWDIQAELDRRFTAFFAKEENRGRSGWPTEAELLLLHSGKPQPAETETRWPRLSIQKGVEWSCLADRWPQPRLYAAVRGGSTDAPHTHQDLTAVRVVVGDEALITHRGNTYIDTTFSDRRFELYEISAASQNVLLVNGVGLPHPAAVTTSRLESEHWEGVLLDATKAQSAGTPAVACGRAVVMLRQAALLIVDRVSLRHAGQAEARFHSLCPVRRGQRSARIRGARHSLHAAFAASVPAGLQYGLGLPTMLKDPPEAVLRWITRGRHHDIVLATLLTPDGTGRLTLNAKQRVIRSAGEGFRVALRYPAEGLGLEPA